MLSQKTQRAISRAIQLIKEESQSYTTQSVVTSSEAAKNIFKLLLSGQEREHFAVSFLTNQHEVLETEILFSGTINQSAVYPREIAKRALQLNAAAVIIGHNHPSGILQPSQSDLQITKHIKEAMKLLDISLLDHILIADYQTYSFSENGQL